MSVDEMFERLKEKTSGQAAAVLHTFTGEWAHFYENLKNAAEQIGGPIITGLEAMLEKAIGSSPCGTSRAPSRRRGETGDLSGLKTQDVQVMAGKYARDLEAALARYKKAAATYFTPGNRNSKSFADEFHDATAELEKFKRLYDLFQGEVSQRAKPQFGPLPSRSGRSI
jgi:hypothetical protein